MKKVQAFIAALVVTVLIGLGMFAIGINAVANASTPPSQGQTANTDQVINVVSNQAGATDAATQIAQLKGLIAQYQSREKQYQSQIADANQKLSTLNQQVTDANQQVQSLTGVLMELQQRGIIRVMSDGSIQLMVRGRGD